KGCSCDGGGRKSSEDRSGNGTGSSRAAALHESNERVASAGNETAITGDRGSSVGSSVVDRRFKIERSLGDVPVGAEETEAQAKIQRQSFVDAPVVLEIGLEDFVAVVVLHDGAGLRIGRNVSCKEVRKRISGGDRRSLVKSQDATETHRGRGAGLILRSEEH